MEKSIISRGELAHILGKNTVKDELYWYKKIGKDIRNQLITPQEDSGNLFFSIEEAKRYLMHIGFLEHDHREDQSTPQQIREVLKRQGLLSEEEFIHNIQKIVK